MRPYFGNAVQKIRILCDIDDTFASRGRRVNYPCKCHRVVLGIERFVEGEEVSGEVVEDR